jgi:uracil-DNA glycosylase
MVPVALEVEIVGMDPDDRAADKSGFGIPLDPIADLEVSGHLLILFAADAPDHIKSSSGYLFPAGERDRSLLAEVRACRACADVLPFGPRPVLQMSESARLLIVGQAPGSKVHASGIPFTDDSGARLRDWLGMTADEFYDDSKVALLPMGLCYPGRKGAGDAPPRPECAPLWRQRLLAQMPAIRLTLLVGTYAQDHELGPGKMTERVRDFRRHLPTAFPLPHPSWRSRHWAAQNPWFEAEVLPELRSAVRAALA